MNKSLKFCKFHKWKRACVYGHCNLKTMHRTSQGLFQGEKSWREFDDNAVCNIGLFSDTNEHIHE